ncbi:DnaD domain-containing protein [Chloroflexota bacterium]
MKQLTGFPNKMEFTPIPNFFFGNILPQISDMAELKTTLHVLAMLYRKRGYPRFVAYNELLGNTGLMNGLKGMAKPPEEILCGALEAASRRGTLIKVVLDREGMSEDVYFLNAESERQVAAKIQSGELKLPEVKAGRQVVVPAEEQPDIFTLYEQNIGMLTPLIAEELREAEKLYPEAWIGDAIKEAVSLNKRNIRYIVRILERWSAEGKSDGAYQRYSKKGPDKYIKQKYGHIVRR